MTLFPLFLSFLSFFLFFSLFFSFFFLFFLFSFSFFLFLFFVFFWGVFVLVFGFGFWVWFLLLFLFFLGVSMPPIIFPSVDFSSVLAYVNFSPVIVAVLFIFGALVSVRVAFLGGKLITYALGIEMSPWARAAANRARNFAAIEFLENRAYDLSHARGLSYEQRREAWREAREARREARWLGRHLNYDGE